MSKLPEVLRGIWEVSHYPTINSVELLVRMHSIFPWLVRVVSDQSASIMGRTQVSVLCVNVNCCSTFLFTCKGKWQISLLRMDQKFTPQHARWKRWYYLLALVQGKEMYQLQETCVPGNKNTCYCASTTSGLSKWRKVLEGALTVAWMLIWILIWTCGAKKWYRHNPFRSKV